MNKKLITIFGSSFPKENDEEYKYAYELGKKLAINGYSICNGGFYGTMEATAKGASECGAHTIGVVIGKWGFEPNPYIKEVIYCNSLFERITKLIEPASGFIVLKGGTGTLLELSAIWELVNKSFITNKPIIAVESFWKPLIDMMNIQMKHENRSTDLVTTLDDIDEIINFLNKKT